MKTRFAPSPTGYIHAGNVRVAILNYLLAKRHNGSFVLRIDDTDTERSKPEYEQAIIEDLHWLGMEWDEFYRQSERDEFYAAGIQKLKDDGRLYACYETAEELDLKRKSTNSQLYDREGLRLTSDKKFQYEQQGRKPHWRFLLHDIDVSWHDLSAGDLYFKAGNVSDPVLIRSDNRPLYTLTSVIDDGLIGISCILRGEDHITNTAAQIQLFKALGYEPPQFAHFPRMTSADGAKLSKRMGSLSLRELRQSAIVPTAIVAYLGRMGSNIAGSTDDNLHALIGEFDLKNFGRAAPKFTPDELELLSMKYMQTMGFTAIKPYLQLRQLAYIDEPIWQLLAQNINHIDELAEWHTALQTRHTPHIDDLEFINNAKKLLPAIITEDSAKQWLQDVKTQLGRSGRALFHPIRHYLTGRDDGPTIPAIMQYLGREKL